MSLAKLQDSMASMEMPPPSELISSTTSSAISGAEGRKLRDQVLADQTRVALLDAAFVLVRACVKRDELLYGIRIPPSMEMERLFGVEPLAAAEPVADVQSVEQPVAVEPLAAAEPVTDVQSMEQRAAVEPLVAAEPVTDVQPMEPIAQPSTPQTVKNAQPSSPASGPSSVNRREALSPGLPRRTRSLPNRVAVRSYMSLKMCPATKKKRINPQ